MKKVLLLCLLCASAFNLNAASEADYQNAWQQKLGGEPEVVLEDGSRVDLLTDEFAIEIDWADKWAEAIGQCLHYADMSGKRPGIILIMQRLEDLDHYQKIERLNIRHNLGIRIWLAKPADLQQEDES